MKNKTVVTIAGREYTMVAVEDEAYLRKCAEHVDRQLGEIMNGRLSQADAAVLAAMNIADQYFNPDDLRAILFPPPDQGELRGGQPPEKRAV